MVTAIHHSVCFQSVTNDATFTMLARWCQCLNGAFKAVKKMRLAVFHNLKTFVVLIAAGFTSSHAKDPNSFTREICRNGVELRG